MMIYGHDFNKNVTEIFSPEAAGEQAFIVTCDYAPYGRINSVEGDMEISPFYFSSEYFDSELGLVYYNYRHYNPADGRWISRDAAEEEYSQNLYYFVKNNPSNFVDILGLKEEESIKTGDPCPICCTECKRIGNKILIQDNGTKKFLVKMRVLLPAFEQKANTPCSHEKKCSGSCCHISYVWYTCYTKICKENTGRTFERTITASSSEAAWRSVAASVKGYTWCSCKKGKWDCKEVKKTSNILIYKVDSVTKPTAWILLTKPTN